MQDKVAPTAAVLELMGALQSKLLHLSLRQREASGELEFKVCRLGSALQDVCCEWRSQSLQERCTLSRDLRGVPQLQGRAR